MSLVGLSLGSGDLGLGDFSGFADLAIVAISFGTTIGDIDRWFHNRTPPDAAVSGCRGLVDSEPMALALG